MEANMPGRRENMIRFMTMRYGGYRYGADPCGDAATPVHYGAPPISILKQWCKNPAL
jgi:hypothetical protein